MFAQNVAPLISHGTGRQIAVADVQIIKLVTIICQHGRCGIVQKRHVELLMRLLKPFSASRAFHAVMRQHLA
jgi:hypothetical protein